MGELMEPLKIPTWLLEGLIVAAIIAIAAVWFFGPESVVELTQKNLTPPITVSFLNEKLADGIKGPVTIDPLVQGGSYFYTITVTPKLKFFGTASDTNIISIITFKDQSVRADVNFQGGPDTFTVRPQDDDVEPRLTKQITSDIPPIRISDQKGFYRGFLDEKQNILIKSSTGAALVSVDISRTNTLLPNFVDRLLFDCKAIFSFKCGKKEAWKYSNYLKGCTPDGKLSDCEESIELCGGTAEITIYDKPDCANNRVETDLSYSGGTAFEEAGETVGISFWKDTTCTRKTSDFQQLLAQCSEYKEGGEVRHDWVGGAFYLNAGILQQ